MTGKQVLTLTVGPREWLTSNARHSWPERARRVKALRYLARVHARSLPLHPVTGPAFVTVQATYRAGRGIDADNIQPAVKAVLDGLTDAGIWPDDSGQHVAAVIYLPAVRDSSLRRGFHGLRVAITPSLSLIEAATATLNPTGGTPTPAEHTERNTQE